MRALVSVVCAVFVSGCSFFGVRSGTEHATYSVVERLDDGVEIRRYPSQLVA